MTAFVVDQNGARRPCLWYGLEGKGGALAALQLMHLTIGQHQEFFTQVFMINASVVLSFETKIQYMNTARKMDDQVLFLFQR